MFPDCCFYILHKITQNKCFDPQNFAQIIYALNKALKNLYTEELHAYHKIYKKY